MELPHLGQHCSQNACNKLDFLPIRCDACNQTFCTEHYNYLNHNCPNTYEKNNQVPVCPLCNTPIPVGRGLQPDIVVGAHIDNDCQADPAKDRRKVFTNKCSVRKCKTKEVIPVVCDECRQNYCLKHRHPTDHQCDGKPKRFIDPKNVSCRVQGNISEDEALARALALSMQEGNGLTDKQRQEQLDLALARQLQAAERPGTATTAPDRNSRRGDRCNVS